MPAHTSSWFKGYPELLGSTKWAIDLTREENYGFLSQLLEEVRDLFAVDIYDGPTMIHLGGDETGDCWDTPEIRSWMTAHALTSKADLVRYWVNRLSGIAGSLGIELTLWADFLADTGERVAGFGDTSNPIVFQTWEHSVEESARLAQTISRDVVHSAGFYLDHTWETWQDIYGVSLTPAAGLLGAEACMWTAWADETNFFTEVWPRAAAAAERFWCGNRCSLKASEDAALRIAKWRCRQTHLFGHSDIANIGDAWSDTIEDFWVYASHADRSAWYCVEEDMAPPPALKISASSSAPISILASIVFTFSTLN